MLLQTMVFLSFVVAAGSASAQHVVAGERDVVFFNHSVARSAVGLTAGVPEEVVQKAQAALNLSEVQVAAVKALLTLRAQTTQQIFQEVEAAQSKLNDLSNLNSNPTEVGTAYLAVRAAHERVRAAEEKFRTDFKALLNEEQRAVLARLDAASQQIATLRMLGVLSGAEMGIGMPFVGALPAHVNAVRIR